MPMDPTQAALAAQIFQGQSGMGQVPVGQIQQMDPRIQAICQQMMRSMMGQSSPQNQMSGMGQIPVNELRGPEYSIYSLLLVTPTVNLPTTLR